MSMQNEPSENDIFAMSDPFSGAAAQAFSGVDAFSPGGPMPVFAAAASAPAIKATPRPALFPWT